MINWIGKPGEPTVSGAGPVAVNVVSQADLLADLDRRLAAGKGFTVATLNLDHVVKLRTQPNFMDAYTRHSHVTADGHPIVWLSKIAGRPVELVPGCELVEPLAAIAQRRRLSVAFVGSTETSLEGAARALRRKCPDLSIVAQISPPMGFDPLGQGADDIVAQLKAAGADMVFLALGAPKQEVFAAHASERLPGVGFLCIGAGLDFLSGEQVRAPRVFRIFAMEWLWRLASNPRRLARRYAACFGALPGLTIQALRCRFQAGEGAP